MLLVDTKLIYDLLGIGEFIHFLATDLDAYLVIGFSYSM